jgi:hypothetical protein
MFTHAPGNPFGLRGGLPHTTPPPCRCDHGSLARAARGRRAGRRQFRASPTDLNECGMLLAEQQQALPCPAALSVSKQQLRSRSTGACDAALTRDAPLRALPAAARWC